MKMKRILFPGAVLCLTLLTAFSAFPQDWPQWRGINRDAKVTGFKVPQTWPVQLEQSWRVTVGLGDATPALVDERLYVFTKQGDEESLKCLDASTGEQIWITEGYFAPIPTGGASRHPGPRSTPAVADGKVVTVGVAGIISCFDAETGKLIWRSEAFTGVIPQFYIGMSPVITDGMVVAHLGGTGAGQFVAFDLETGKIRWQTTGDAPVYASPALMTVEGTAMIVFQGETKLTGIRLADGSQLWEIETPLGPGRVNPSTSPVIDGRKIYYTGMNNGINAVEIIKQGNNFTVNTLWKNPEISTAYNTPVLTEGYLYGLSNINKLFCISASDGETAWIDETAYQNFGSIVNAGSVMVAVSSTTDMIAYKPVAGEFTPVAKMKIAETPVYAHPILAGDRIYIKDENTLIMYKLD